MPERYDGNMAKRKSIPQKVRFEVFKRDNFTCQYCGRSAPDVILEVDHINPVANGGDNDITNLITSCKDCNRGKGARKLTDKQEISKEKQKLDEINERRKQLEMMLKWREELAKIDDSEVIAYEKDFCDHSSRTFTDTGRDSAKKFIKKYGLQLMLDSLDTSFSTYAKYDSDGKITAESASKVFDMAPRIAYHKQHDDLDPSMQNVFYCRGILRNRLSYIDERKSVEYLKLLFTNGDTFESVKDYCCHVRNWTQFRTDMEELFGRIS